jgi:uncharacterized LabA/DUF88 family protein
LNYAYIDSQNLNLATQNMGWNMDWAKFRAWLKSEYQVEIAYLFIGYMPEHQEIYSAMQKAGYIVIFKPVTVSREGEVKGNVDADLVLQAMIDFDRYDGAVLVTGDGDFASLVSHLNAKNKLKMVIIPNQHQHSQMLRTAAKDKVLYLNDQRNKLQYHRRPQGTQRKPQGEQGKAPQAAPAPQSVQSQPATTPQARQPQPRRTPRPALRRLLQNPKRQQSKYEIQ